VNCRKEYLQNAALTEQDFLLLLNAPPRFQVGANECLRPMVYSLFILE